MIVLGKAKLHGIIYTVCMELVNGFTITVDLFTICAVDVSGFRRCSSIMQGVYMESMCKNAHILHAKELDVLTARVGALLRLDTGGYIHASLVVSTSDLKKGHSWMAFF